MGKKKVDVLCNLKDSKEKNVSLFKAFNSGHSIMAMWVKFGNEIILFMCKLKG